MASREIDAEAQLVLTVMLTGSASRLELGSGEAYPKMLATRTMVGVRVEVEPTAPTPVGARVATLARYLSTKGKLHLFAVEAFDPGGRIGKGGMPAPSSTRPAGADRLHN